MINFLIVVLTLFCVYLLCVRCRRGHKDWDELVGWSYTHRGLFGNGIPENSMKAFRKAKESGYGIEMDIHLMADGNLAIVHDSSLKRMTNADVCIEDLRAEDLVEYPLDDGLETIPLFNDVLQMIDGEVPLILELKSVKNNYAELCRTACDLLDSYNGAFCLESFDPRCVYWLKKNRPDLIRGQLSVDYLKHAYPNMPWLYKFVVSNQLLNFITVPDFIAYGYADRKKLSNFACRKVWGAKGVSWTVKNQQEYDQAVKEDWIPIFEGFCP